MTAAAPALMRDAGTTAPDPVARACALGPAILAAADTIEATRRIPEPLLGELHAARIFRMLMPRSCGGDQIDPSTYFRAIAQIARHDGSVAWNAFVANSSVLIAAFLEPQAARTIFSDPKALVAWGPPNACRARAVPGGYRVTGRWDFASGCRQATWIGAHCNVVEPDGTLRKNRFGLPTIRTLLMPVAQASLIDTWNTIGLRGTASDSYAIEDQFVAEAFSSTREDPDLPREPGALYAFTMSGLYAVGVAGVAQGIARAMLDAFIALARRKTPRGQGRLADSASIQGEIGRAEARLGSACAYLTTTLDDVFARAPQSGSIGIEDRGRVRLVCAQAIHEALAVADVVYKAAGVDAIFPGTPFERRFRDIHTLSQQIQSRSSHFEAVGRILLGEPPEHFL